MMIVFYAVGELLLDLNSCRTEVAYFDNLLAYLQ